MIKPLTWVGITSPKPIKMCQECRVDILTSGETIITIYGETTNSESYTLGQETQ